MKALLFHTALALLAFPYLLSAQQDQLLNIIEQHIKSSEQQQAIREFDAVLRDLEQADSLLQSIPETHDTLFASIQYHKGIAYYNLGRYANAQTSLDTALSIYLHKQHLGYAADCYLWLGNVEWYTLGSATAIPTFEQAIAYAERDERGERRYRGKYYVDKGYALLYEGDFYNGRLSIEEGVRKDIDYYGYYHLSTAASLMVEGTFHLHNEDYYQALQSFDKVEAVYDSLIVDRGSPDFAVLYGNQGKIYLYLSQVNKAEKYFHKALGIFEHSLAPNHPNLLLAYISLGEVYLNLEEYEQSKAYNQRAIDGSGEQLPMIALAGILGNAYYYRGKEDYDAERQALLKALEMVKARPSSQIKSLSLIYELLGENARKQQLYAEAIGYLEESLEAYQMMFGEKHQAVARVNALLGKVYLYKEDADSTLIVVQRGLDIMWEPHQSFDKVFSPDVWCLLMDLKAKAYTLMAVSDDRYWKQVLVTYTLLDQYHDYIRNDFGDPEDKRLIANYAAETHSNLIKTAVKLMGKDQEMASFAFQIAEKSRANVLLKAMKQAGIPQLDSFYATARPLKDKLEYYELKLYEAEQYGGYDDLTLTRWRANIFDLERQLSTLREAAKASDPDLFAAIELDAYSSPADVQAKLEPGQGLLEYFVAPDSSIFLFLITKEDYIVKELKQDFPLNHWVQAMRENISLPMPFAYEAYLEIAPKLYDKLLAPVAGQLPERLVIVPDGILGYLPFEALLTGPPEPGNAFAAEQLPYLLREHEISYSYSVTLLQEMQARKHRLFASKGMLAMAPFADIDVELPYVVDKNGKRSATPRDTLSGLPYSRAEIDSLKLMLSADALLGAKATKAAFLKRAGGYRLLHLSTHGKADAVAGRYSYLAFFPQSGSLSDELLYVNELYNLQLYADLVVLSACETGVGELQKGEGIISLAHGFAYAGAKSIVTSLWQVNDKSTQELMVSFYNHLDKGLAKDAALRQAKLDFINQHKGNDAFPFYWAAFIGLGDMEPIIR
jgi:CHAT domain-containing protein/uncharacterized protein HemY